MAPDSLEDHPTDRERVLTNATLRAAQRLDLSDDRVAAMLGISEPEICRYRNGETYIDDGTKDFEQARLFIQVFISLGWHLWWHETSARSWMFSENIALKGIPAEQIASPIGLSEIAAYLDSRTSR